MAIQLSFFPRFYMCLCGRMRLLCYLSKWPRLALSRNKTVASGELILQRNFIAIPLSNQSRRLPSAHRRPVDSWRCSTIRDFSPFVTSAEATTESESRLPEDKLEHCKMAPPVKAFERLPKSVVPIHYEITIKPDLFKLVFEGHESVTLKVWNHSFL